MKVTLAAITVYPVKSIGGMDLSQAEVEAEGLADDRRWVIVDEGGTFVSQRTHPLLAVISARPQGNGWILEAPGCPVLTIDPDAGDGSRLPVAIWNDQVDAAGGFHQADTWLSSFLGKPIRLATMDTACTRFLRPGDGAMAEPVSFADGYPCLLTSTASLDDLNARLAEPLPMDRFRPNLVVTGCDPFAEDGWQTLRIGSAEFQVAGPCARCSVTTVDQERGVPVPKEPLKTLATYRRGPKGVEFGVNLRVIRPGTVTLGDTVEIRD